MPNEVYTGILLSGWKGGYCHESRRFFSDVANFIFTIYFNNLDNLTSKRVRSGLNEAKSKCFEILPSILFGTGY